MPPPPPGAVPVMSHTMRGKTARDGRPTPGVVVEARAGGLVMRLGTPNPISWTPAFRAEVAALLRRLRAEADGGIIVLTGAHLFERDDETHLAFHSKLPDFSDLLAALAAPGVPVVAAIPGGAFGGGLELALACHARVAGPDASFGLPDVRYGRLPANGGIPHLAALVDPESALAMVAFGETVSAPAALRIGLIDAIAEADPVGAQRLYEQALELDAEHGAARVGLAKLLLEAGDAAGAERRIEGIGKTFRDAGGVEDGPRCQKAGEASGIIRKRRSIRRAHDLRREAGEQGPLRRRNQ